MAKRLGFIVNPIAGMGGTVGLKGTDGEEALRRALELGATPVAPLRARRFLEELARYRQALVLVTPKGQMGEEIARELGFEVELLSVEVGEKTTAEHTKQAAKELVDREVELLVFCGGDGTARDILDAIDMKIPVLGIPAGVKMHSAVFATNPRAAANVVVKYLWGELGLMEAEVMDVDEEAFRENRLSAKLYGYMLIPHEPELVQSGKEATPLVDSERENQLAIARYVVENMEDDVIYILSAGTTVKAICDVLGEDKTLLGVDLMKNKKIIALDVNEQQILKAIEGRKAKIIVSPIGRQGFIFGRGNQQNSARVIRKVGGPKGVIIIATPSKLKKIRCLRVDTGDEEVDSMFRGYLRVVIDYGRERMVECC